MKAAPVRGGFLVGWGTMSQYVTNCARCGAKHSTHNVCGSNPIDNIVPSYFLVEVYLVCRNCHKGHIRHLVVDKKKCSADLYLEENGLIDEFDDLGIVIAREGGVVTFAPVHGRLTPEHLPTEIEELLLEAHTSLSSGCPNAAGACYRLVLDKVAKAEVERLASSESGNLKTIHKRVEWLAEKQHFPHTLKQLADCIRLDGNDAAHEGTLTNIDAEELADFTTEFLIRVYTDPKRLELAEQRRQERRSGKLKPA